MKPDEAIPADDQPNALSPKPATSEREGVEHKATSSRSSGVAAVIALILLLLLPMAYVLSIGPVIWLDSRQYIDVQGGSFVATFYRPLEYAHGRWPTAAKPLDWYVELWNKRAEWLPHPVPTAPPTYSTAPVSPPPVGPPPVGQGVPTARTQPPSTYVPASPVNEGSRE